MIFTETIRAKSAWMDDYFENKLGRTQDYIEKVYPLYQWFSMILSLIIVGAVLLSIDEGA